MPAFQYKAIDKTGQPARGKLDAANEVDLELRLRRMGLDLITFRTIRAGGPAYASGSVSRRDLITFCFDLEQISRSGIPLIEGLRDLRNGSENPRFREILSEAEATGMPNPNAMTLSTVDAAGQPSSRQVLLKGVDERGFVFYTNLESRKGRELAGNPQVSLNFHWRQLDKQVVVLGTAERVSDEEADAYFATRARTSQPI